LQSANYGETFRRMPTLPRDRLIETHLPLVRALARRFAWRGEPLDDLIQVGAIGLIHAVDRYDPALGPFEAYAIPTIIGEIRRHLRDRGALMRVPAGAAVAVRIEPLEEADGPPADPIAGVIDRLALAAALRSLPLHERRIVVLGYYGERTQRRIADDVGISQIHVSRLMRRALERMRPALDDGVPVARPPAEA
jgi:RNA polymerase sigma-B factor